MNQQIINQIIKNYDTPYTHSLEHAAICEYGNQYHIHVTGGLSNDDLSIWCDNHGFYFERHIYGDVEFVIIIAHELDEKG